MGWTAHPLMPRRTEPGLMAAQEVPLWVWCVLCALAGVVVTLALGPASDAFWEAVYWARRLCLIVGAVVLAGAVFGGAGWLLLQAYGS